MDPLLGHQRKNKEKAGGKVLATLARVPQRPHTDSGASRGIGDSEPVEEVAPFGAVSPLCLTSSNFPGRVL
jgi:hypothetical protein